MLPWAQYWYNFAFHHSMGTSPYQTIYDKPPSQLDILWHCAEQVEGEIAPISKLYEETRR